MNDNKINLDDLWFELEANGIPWGSTLASGLGEVSKFVSLNASLQRTLLIQTKIKPPQYTKFDSVQVGSNQTEGGDWFLTFELQDSNHKQEFTQLCLDMLEGTFGISDEEQTHVVMNKAYSDWLDFYKSSRKMSLEAARGLFGELWFLKTYGFMEYGEPQAILSWVGPLGAAQDFVFQDFKAFEIKTQQPSSDSLKISSVNQLEYDGQLFLVKYRISNSKSPKFGYSLSGLIEVIKSELDGTPQVAEFAKKISMLGLDFQDPSATEMYFNIDEPKFYEASQSGFPRLASKDIPEGVRRTTYEIHVPSLLPFEVAKP